ncbi:MAG: hypothetical protein AAF349_08445 [Cyanobacteria bacterium P01_A01_bin.68]
MKLQLATIVLFLLIPISVKANPLLHGEFDYDLKDRKFSEWQLGPVFSIGEDMEIEIPIGQSDGEWELLPEFKRDFCTSDKCSIEIGIGAEIPFNNEKIEPFGKIEAELGL